MTTIIRNIGIALLFVLSMAACQSVDPVCPDRQSYDFKLGLTRITDSTSTRLKVYNPNLPDSLNIGNKFPSLLSVPVDVTNDSTYFFIDFINDSTNTRTTDTIAFTYNKNAYIEYRECGFVMEFELLKVYVGGSNIDSVFWINNMLNEDNALNLQIYY